jgi:hypothetical protein
LVTARSTMSGAAVACSDPGVGVTAVAPMQGGVTLTADAAGRQEDFSANHCGFRQD